MTFLLTRRDHMDLSIINHKVDKYYCGMQIINNTRGFQRVNTTGKTPGPSKSNLFKCSQSIAREKNPKNADSFDDRQPSL